MNEYLDISPKQLTFTLEDSLQQLQIQNLTLQFIQIKVISPNPALISIPQTQPIEPCSSVTYDLRLNIENNCYDLSYNRKLVILYYEMDDEDNQDWRSQSQIGREEITLNYEMPSLKYKLFNDATITQLFKNMQMLQLMDMNGHYQKFNDENKQIVINTFKELFQSYETFKVMDDRILFIGKQYIIPNDIIVITNAKPYIYLLSYKPSYWIQQTIAKNSKNEIEPMSPYVPKQLIKQSKIKEISQLQQLDSIVAQSDITQSEQQQQNISSNHFIIEQNSQLKGEEQQQSQAQTNKQSNKQQEQQQQSQQQQQQQQSQQQQQQYKDLITKFQTPQTKRNSKEEIRQSFNLQQQNNSAKQANFRSQSINIKKSDSESDQKILTTPLKQQMNVNKWDKKAKLEQQTQVQPPIVFTLKEEMQQTQQSLEIKEIAQMKTFQRIQHILIFRDCKYLITVGEKQDIKVWNLQIKGLVGQLKDLEMKKDRKCLLIQEWRYMDPNADENYDFQVKNPVSEKQQILYSPYETAYRFIVGSEDQVFRIFNLTSMKLEQQFNCRLQIPTSLAFMPDRGLFCIGGQPYKTIFGQIRKYRSIRFFCMNNFQEKPKYKIFCKHEDEYLASIVYSENPSLNHARLNNTLGIAVYRRNNQGKQIASTAKLYFIFIDRMNNCTVLLTMECEQLNIRGINEIKYLYKQGQFAVIEANDVISSNNHQLYETSQKVVLVNLKLQQTQNGMQNGLECALIQESKSKLSLQVLNNPTLIVIPQTKQLIFQNLQGEEQSAYQFEVEDLRQEYSLQMMTSVNQYIALVIEDTVQVLLIKL